MNTLVITGSFLDALGTQAVKQLAEDHGWTDEKFGDVASSMDEATRAALERHGCRTVTALEVTLLHLAMAAHAADPANSVPSHESN